MLDKSEARRRWERGRKEIVCQNTRVLTNAIGASGLPRRATRYRWRCTRSGALSISKSYINAELNDW